MNKVQHQVCKQLIKWNDFSSEREEKANEDQETTNPSQKRRQKWAIPCRRGCAKEKDLQVLVINSLQLNIESNQ